MNTPHVTRKLKILPGNIEDYRRFARWHYRDGSSPGPYESIYCLRQPSDFRGTNANRPVGVIVYSMPTENCTARDIATDGFFKGLSRPDRQALLNRYVRRISRVIIEPRYRGCGLAALLVKKTMPLVNVPIIEALASMGHFNFFFEKAGLTACHQAIPARNKMLTEALSLVGIELQPLYDAQAVCRSIESLNHIDKAFIEKQFIKFLNCFGRQDPKLPTTFPNMETIERILSKLTIPPVYFIWFNPNEKCERQERYERNNIS
jgi:hypothetical protein